VKCSRVKIQTSWSVIGPIPRNESIWPRWAIWGPYGPYIGFYWGWFYTTVSASSTREGSLIADLIDPRSKALDWRVYLIRKITNPDKDWKKADEEFTKGSSYPPSEKEKEARKKEREEHQPKDEQP
jgi:hypothetical protein